MVQRQSVGGGVLVACCLVAAGGCDGDGAAGQTGAATLRIAYLSEFSGPNAPARAAPQRGADLAVALINDLSLDLQVELIKKDVAGDPERMVALIDEVLAEGVRLIVSEAGVAAEGKVRALAPKLTEAGALYLGTTPFVAIGDLGELIWSATPEFTITTAATVSALRALGVEKYFFIVPESQAAVLTHLVAQPLIAAGMPTAIEAVPDAALVNPDMYDFAPHLDSIHGQVSDANFLVAPSSVPSAVSLKIVLQWIDAFPSRVPYFTFPLTVDAAALPATAVERYIGFGAGNIGDYPQSSWFVERFSRVFGEPPGTHADFGFENIVMLALASAAAGSSEPAAVAAQLPQITRGGSVVVLDDLGAVFARAASGEDIDVQGVKRRLEMHPQLRRDSEMLLRTVTLATNRALSASLIGQHCGYDDQLRVTCMPLDAASYLQ